MPSPVGEGAHDSAILCCSGTYSQRPHLIGGGNGSSIGCNFGFGCVRLKGSGLVFLRLAVDPVPVNLRASASQA